MQKINLTNREVNDLTFKLKCCGKTNPIGIDKEHLRLSFEVEGDIEILSYEIRIASSSKKLTEGKCDVVISNENAANYEVWVEQAYFKERTRYYWQVVAQTSTEDIVSEIASFETGIGSWSAEGSDCAEPPELCPAPPCGRAPRCCKWFWDRCCCSRRWHPRRR